MSSALVPIPVALPLAIAGLMLASGKLLPRRGPDVVAIGAALIAGTLCLILALSVRAAPITYWFGGWTPRDGQTIGISFHVDLAGASIATFVGFLFAVTMAFAWGYFEKVHAHFHVLMLLFMSAMIGFCLTGDIFNLFVWFEVMSVAAYALTGYELRSSPLEGAINFTVVNSVGSYLFLGGIGVAYSFAGSLDMESIGRAVATAHGDPVVGAAFVLMSAGLLIKAAQVPFHFWLPDAHGVAPSPVSVIFSGAMVAMGIFGLSRLVLVVFQGSPGVVAVVQSLLVTMGAASVVVGGAMALLQRHLKRMLAFSTVSHTGLLLIGVALIDRQSMAGALAYLVGHGLVKACLFMIAGILLAKCGGIDEIGLRGLGKPIWPVGLVMAAAGLMLAGLPLGIMDEGLATLSAAARGGAHGWLLPVFVFGAATTGGGVLRAAGRIFLGLGHVAGEEQRSPTEEEREKADRPLPLMLICASIPLLVAIFAGPWASGLAHEAAAQMQAPARLASIEEGSLLAWVAVACALAMATFDLLRHRLPKALTSVSAYVTKPISVGLDALHSGAVGDYVAWLVVGLGGLTAAFWLS